MACFQTSAGNGDPGIRPTYSTEAACLEACKEGACCEGTTCSVKPQCQCQGEEKTFKGVGTTCTPFVLPASALLTASLEYTQLDAGAGDYSGISDSLLRAFYEGRMSGTLAFGMTRDGGGGGNSFSGTNIAQSGMTGNTYTASALLNGDCAGNLSISIATSTDIPFTYPSAYNLGGAGVISGGQFETTYYLYNMNEASAYTTLVTTSSTFPADGSYTTFDPQRTPQTVTWYYIWINEAAGRRWVRFFGTWRVTVRATLTT